MRNWIQKIPPPTIKLKKYIKMKYLKVLKILLYNFNITLAIVSLNFIKNEMALKYEFI